LIGIENSIAGFGVQVSSKCDIIQATLPEQEDATPNASVSDRYMNILVLASLFTIKYKFEFLTALPFTNNIKNIIYQHIPPSHNFHSKSTPLQ
jgi:hypothetical protein